jgi:hypothetical protein
MVQGRLRHAKYARLPLTRTSNDFCSFANPSGTRLAFVKSVSVGISIFNSDSGLRRHLAVYNAEFETERNVIETVRLVTPDIHASTSQQSLIRSWRRAEASTILNLVFD